MHSLWKNLFKLENFLSGPLNMTNALILSQTLHKNQFSSVSCSVNWFLKQKHIDTVYSLIQNQTK